MNVSVSLTDELNEFVADRIASGKYSSASDVVQNALRLLEQHEDNARKLDWLRKAYQEGIDSGNAGPLDFEELKAEARRRFNAKSG